MISNIEEISIVVCGPVDAGKSSLVGVLTTGELDDGRGRSS
jgi:elongation factor 1-alpha